MTSEKSSLIFRNGLVVLVLILSLGIVSAAYGKSTDGFDLSSSSVKASVEKGDSITKSLSISKGHEKTVYLKSIGLNGVSFSEESFSLSAEESKDIQIFFNSSGLEPGVYVGSIKIYDDKDTFFIPTIFEVKSQDVLYDVYLDVSPEYGDISPNGKFAAQIKIFDLVSGGTSGGLGRSAVNIEYSIKNLNGETVINENASTFVEKQTQLSKSFSFPKNIPLGDYVFTTTVKYKSSVGVASYLFTIEGTSHGAGIFSWLTQNFDIQFLITLIVIIVFFFVLLIVFVLVIRDRDSIIMDLKKYNETEFCNQKNFIQAQENILRKKGVSESNIMKEKKQKMDKLNNHLKERLEKMKELKKNGDEKVMQDQLVKWKKQGFNTLGLEYKMKGLSKDEMNDLLSMWKKQYGESEGYKKKEK